MMRTKRLRVSTKPTLNTILQGLKMKKKRAGVVSSLKMIHGNSLEAVENRICSARTALIEATADLQELSHVRIFNIGYFVQLLLSFCVLGILHRRYNYKLSTS